MDELHCVKELKDLFPHDPKFIDEAIAVISLHGRKSYDYAAGGNPLSDFYREATILSLYPNLDMSDPRVVVMVRMLKQIDAVFWGLNQRHAQSESMAERMRDVTVFSIIFRILDDEIRESKTESGNRIGLP